MRNIISEQKGAVLWLTLNRPDKLNALSDAMMSELAEAITAADQDDGVKLLVLCGAGKGFSAGAAIDEMADDNANSLRARRFITSNWEDLARFSKPTIAMVHGFALGGGLELAMMADIIITTPDAKLALPEITLGVMPGAGGSQRLPRLLPPMLAQYLILSGARLSGADAHHHGLAACLYDSAQIMAETTLLAEKIASASLPALKSIKQSFHDARNLPLAEGIGRERERFYNLFDTAEQKAAMKKFLSR